MFNRDTSPHYDHGLQYFVRHSYDVHSAATPHIGQFATTQVRFKRRRLRPVFNNRIVVKSL